MRKKFKLGRSWKYLLQHQKPHMRFLTVIFGVIRVREFDLGSRTCRERIMSELVQMSEQHHYDMTSIGRGRHMSGMTRRGRIEIDLRRDLGEHVIRTLNGMGVDTSPLTPDERIMVVHSHIVIEASKVAIPNDVDGEVWAKDLRDTIQSRWPAPWQTLLKPLWKNQTAQEAVVGLAEYIEKRDMKYAEGGYGDEKTVRRERYERQWLLIVQQAYGRIDSDMRSKR